MCVCVCDYCTVYSGSRDCVMPDKGRIQHELIITPSAHLDISLFHSLCLSLFQQTIPLSLLLLIRLPSCRIFFYPSIFSTLFPDCQFIWIFFFATTTSYSLTFFHPRRHILDQLVQKLRISHIFSKLA